MEYFPKSTLNFYATDHAYVAICFSCFEAAHHIPSGVQHPFNPTSPCKTLVNKKSWGEHQLMLPSTGEMASLRVRGWCW